VLGLSSVGVVTDRVEVLQRHFHERTEEIRGFQLNAATDVPSARLPRGYPLRICYKHYYNDLVSRLVLLLGNHHGQHLLWERSTVRVMWQGLGVQGEMVDSSMHGRHRGQLCYGPS